MSIESKYYSHVPSEDDFGAMSAYFLFFKKDILAQNFILHSIFDVLIMSPSEYPSSGGSKTLGVWPLGKHEKGGAAFPWENTPVSRLASFCGSQPPLSPQADYPELVISSERNEHCFEARVRRGKELGLVSVHAFLFPLIEKHYFEKEIH